MFYFYEGRKKISLLGLILIAVGIIMLLQALGYLGESFWKYFWPTVLVVLGVKIVLESLRFPKGSDKNYIDAEKEEK